MAAPDVRTVSRLLANGTATVVFSSDRNAGVLVLNNVAAPSPRTMYQLWLIEPKGPKSAGTMASAAVSSSMTATLTDPGKPLALAFTLELGAGSPRPTTPILATLPLS